MTYLLWRHIVAAIMLAAVMPRTVRQTTRRDWLYGAVLGLFLFIAFVTQTIGLQWTTPGKSGFITSLYIVMVPFLYWIVTRRSPGWTQIGGAVIATIGLGLLSFRGGLGMSKGDLLTLVGALGFAAQIAATGFFAPRTKPAVLALTQIVAAAVLFIVVTPFVEHITWDFGWQAWAAIVWTALSGTVFGFMVQAWAQKSTTSTRAAVILGLEGLFAAAFGLLFGMDVLSWRFAAGAALILAGVLVIETLPGPARRAQPGRRAAARGLRRAGPPALAGRLDASGVAASLWYAWCVRRWTTRGPEAAWTGTGKTDRRETLRRRGARRTSHLRARRTSHPPRRTTGRAHPSASPTRQQTVFRPPRRRPASSPAPAPRRRPDAACSPRRRPAVYRTTSRRPRRTSASPGGRAGASRSGSAGSSRSASSSRSSSCW